jgi:NAD(P)-dependent dehydrogenase (short-subunit alcohol dehydrogenase family)
MWRARPSEGIAFVTGASSGIGRAVAIELSARGYTVAASARRGDELSRLAASAPKIFSFPADTRDRAQIASIVAAIEAAHGPIALAFLNAGVYFPAEREGFDAEVVWRTFETNVGGTVNCLEPVLKAMRRRGKGQIAITSSLAGYAGVPGSLAYGATKAALIYMAQVLKLTCEPEGITVQVVNPGFVHTPMTEHAPFDLPLIIGADVAAKLICDGFERGGFEITFPRRLAYTLKAALLLPYALFFPLMRRATRRVGGKP